MAKRELHGMKNTKLYSVWTHMKQRCNNPARFGYARYGGRGISYQKSWEKFSNFYRDMSDTYEEGLTLDRINTDRNYTKNNCRWVTRKVQSRNRSYNIWHTYKGRTLCLAEWCEELQVNYLRTKSRIKRGWSIHAALFTPYTEVSDSNKLRGKKFTSRGKRKSLKEWSSYLGIPYGALSSRYYAGWSISRMLYTPVRKKPSNV